MMLGKTSLKMVSQEVVQTEFSVVHGLTRMHGLTRNEDTCEPSAGRINSPGFLCHLPISNILPNSPDFYMFLPNSPDFYLFTSQMCNLHHVHLERHTCGILNLSHCVWHSAEVFDSHFKICFNNFIYQPWVDYSTHLVDHYLNIC